MMKYSRRLSLLWVEGAGTALGRIK